MNKSIMPHIVAIFAILCAPAMSYGATSANISLSGTVAASISVASSATTFDFGDPSVDTLTDAAIATITVNSNASAGYTLNLTNTNSGFFLTDGSNTVNYTLKYDGVALTYGATVELETDNGAGGPTVNSAKGLTVSLTPDSGLPSGTYTDQITVTIVAN